MLDHSRLVGAEGIHEFAFWGDTFCPRLLPFVIQSKLYFYLIIRWVYSVLDVSALEVVPG